MPLSRSQKMSIASMLSVNTLQATLNRLASACAEIGMDYAPFEGFARYADKRFTKRDGFIPRNVVAMIEDESLSPF